MYEKNKYYHERMDWFNKHLPKKCDTIPWSASMNMNIMGLTGSNVNLSNVHVSTKSLPLLRQPAVNQKADNQRGSFRRQPAGDRSVDAGNQRGSFRRQPAPAVGLVRRQPAVNQKADNQQWIIRQAATSGAGGADGSVGADLSAAEAECSGVLSLADARTFP